MSLTRGARLGPYEIRSALGAGGMGEVYRAHDAKLGRDVAIKILPSLFVDDEERVARFEREARILASLNHPNIAAIYGFEEGLGASGRIRGLVLELVDGDTLFERLARRPLSVVDTLGIARQIIDALETAHDRGIVHRDLKPANIKITPDGMVKVLDFGLAKLSALDPTGGGSQIDTTTSDGTRQGVILGTAAYMSPEQARGEVVDKRTDIWAFGCVLFEMLAGRLAFAGATMTDTLAAIIEREPDWDCLPNTTPSPVRQLLKACLVKDAKRRLRDISDARFGLASSDASAVAATEAVPSQTRMMRRRVLLAAASLAIVALSFTLGLSIRRSVPSGITTRSIRLAIPPPPDTQFANDTERIAFGLSPDGAQLAFVTATRGATQIWLRPLSSGTARPIAGTEGARSFMWSPDSTAIAFFAGDKLKRIGLSGGAAVGICDAPAGVGVYGSWSVNNEIVFASIEGEAIYKVSTAGGTPTAIVKRDASRGEARVVWPWFLPDGKRVLFVTRFKDRPGQLTIGGDGRPPRHIAPISSPAQWVDPDYLVFAAEGTLVAQRFDSTAERFVGEPTPIVEPVEHTLATFKAGFSSSRNGMLVYQPNFDVDHLVWLDRSGAELGLVTTPGSYQSIRLSRDDKRLIFDRGDSRIGSPDVWILDLERGAETRITSGMQPEAWPVWIEGARATVFMSARGGAPNLFRKSLTTGEEQELTLVSTLQQATDVSPDERTLAFMLRAARGNFDIWTLALTGAATPTPLLTSPFNEIGLRFSPDGHAMAWTSDEAGSNDIYVAGRPMTGAKIRVSTAGGREPRWSRDGRQLFYLTLDGRVMTVPMQTVPTLTVGKSAVVFTPRGRTWRNFEVTADGRFMAIVPHLPSSEQPLNVVLNWMADLAR